MVLFRFPISNGCRFVRFEFSVGPINSLRINRHIFKRFEELTFLSGRTWNPVVFITEQCTAVITTLWLSQTHRLRVQIKWIAFLSFLDSGGTISIGLRENKENWFQYSSQFGFTFYIWVVWDFNNISLNTLFSFVAFVISLFLLSLQQLSVSGSKRDFAF